ncbi:MAG TPA: STN domain-containing protein, partial [Planctomycetaceae bacterium]|nr:STN domain-containing protein [Planctomycetaceae bacterium]
MLSAVPHRHQRLSLKHIVRAALCLLLLTNVHATLFGEEPTASPQKPVPAKVEAKDTAETRIQQLISKLQRPIDFKFEQKPLSDVLDSISRQHDIRMTREFDAEIDSIAVSSDEPDATLDDALEHLLKPLGLEAKNRGGTLVIAPRAIQATRLRRLIGNRIDL